ncbi:T57 [Hirschfeldia incana]|nr:T57 [Hirschfeldia incana]
MSRLTPPPLLSVNLPIMNQTPDSELTPTRLGFPNEFPYEFDSPAFSPGFTSPGNSTETEDESSDDEEDFLAGLTRRLAPSTHRLPPPNSMSVEKRQATSPQSTLSGLGSSSPIIPPSQAHTTTSFKRDNAWDVISAAAGEVARLKLRSEGPSPSPSLVLRRQNAEFQAERYIQQQQQRLLDQMWLCCQTRTKSSVNEEIAFQNPRNLRRNASSSATWMPQQAVAPPQKRPSTGTGVFIPRRYPATTPSEPIKKSAPVSRTATPQSKVSPPQTLNFDEFTHVGSRLSQFDYECMLARSTLLARQGNFRGVGCLNQERRLPQDWMY